MSVLLFAGGLAALAGCGGGAVPAACDGQRCGADGGPDMTVEGGGPSGDADAAAACGSVQPCGGELTGEWAIGEECLSAARVAATEADFATMIQPTWCAVAKLVGIQPQASGSWRFDAAGTYALDLTFGGSLDINYPMSCLVAFNCDDLTGELQSEIDSGTFPLPSVSSISCSGSSSCLCHATVDYGHAESGTYAVSGDVVTLTPATGAVAKDTFCVQGSTLHILDTSTGSSGQTSVDSDLVAMKR